MLYFKRVAMVLLFVLMLPAFAWTTTLQLPLKGAVVQDFIPSGWHLLDSVSFDFNHDGLEDIAAVTEAAVPQTYDDLTDNEEPWNPRILFVLQNTGDGYVLSLEDENAIRTRDEGGIWGDPWEPLSAEGDAFTVNAYGGSNWRWAEHFTYKYRNDQWVLTQSGVSSYFMGETRSEYLYDYENGRGSRMEANDCGKTVTYEVRLDPPPAIKNYDFNSVRLRPPPLPPFTVKDYRAAPGINIKGIQIPPPSTDESAGGHILHTQDYVGYRFFTNTKEYFAVYHLKSQTVYVVAELDKTAQGFMKAAFNNAWFYNGRIYLNPAYSRDLGRLKETDVDTTKLYTTELIAMQPDGAAPQTLFTHQFETRADYVYLTLLCEFGGGEVVINVYGPDPQLFYRVDINNGKPELLGELGNCTTEEMEAYMETRYDEDN